jgi:hypothetical protein
LAEIPGKVYEALKDIKKRKHMSHKSTIGEIHKQPGATSPEPKISHFYHPWMRKIYTIDLRPHFEQVFARESTLRWPATQRSKDIWRYRVARGVNSCFPDKVSPK